jgi:hypothetical protein
LGFGAGAAVVAGGNGVGGGILTDFGANAFVSESATMGLRMARASRQALSASGSRPEFRSKMPKFSWQDAKPWR